MTLKIYRYLTSLFSFVIKYHVSRRAKRGKEEPDRLSERRGKPSQLRPKDSLVWIHAASIGEVVSTLSLIRRLLDKYQKLSILVTTGTVTSAKIMADALPERAMHQYFPYDVAYWGRRFLNHWQPDLVFWVESELWPNILTEIYSRAIPLIMLNGRLSDKAFQRWRRVPSLSNKVLAGFNICFAQSQQDADRLQTLGASKVKVSSNLKFAASPLPVDKTELDKVKRMIGNRPVWLASSTHQGEEEQIAKAHSIVQQSVKDALCIIVPRHPERGDRIRTQLTQQSFVVNQRSANENIQPNTEIYLADTLAELGLFYRLSPVVFVGGSLVNIGGHNIIEPAQLECAIIHGNHMDNSQEVTKLFSAFQANCQIKDANELARIIAELLTSPTLLKQMVQAAQQVVSTQTQSLEAMLSEIDTSLESLTRRALNHV